MFNAITTFTKKEMNAIKKIRRLPQFYSETLGIFVIDIDEGIDAMGYDFLTKICKLRNALTNSRHEWVVDGLNEDIYVMYKVKAK